MNTHKTIVRFTDVSYAWPDPETNTIAMKKGSLINPVFDMFCADIPSGFISLTGPNGSGKTTFMLLAGARIVPVYGKVELLGNDSRVLSGVWKDETGTVGPGMTAEIEHKRNLLCSFIYQNMEFDTADNETNTVGSLLEYVYMNGGHVVKDEKLYTETIHAMELDSLRMRRLDALSKGEIQRVLLGFSALYGSKVIMMDEPVFALEQIQKERVFDFFKNLNRETDVSVIVSLHELSLTRKYADTVLLFYPDRNIDMGTCGEVLLDSALEKAYGVPAGMLYDTEKLTRRSFIEQAQELL